MVDIAILRRYAELVKDHPAPQCEISCGSLLELLDLLEAAQKDAARLMFACEFDSYVGIEKDRYDYACDCMDEAGRDEPNEEDELNGLRRLIDAKIASKNSGDAR